MKTLKNKKGVYKGYRGPLADWVWKRWEEKGIEREEFAAHIGISDKTLSTMLGGTDRLSKGNLEKLIRGLIQKSCINSGTEVGELLDILRLGPGYKLIAEEEDELLEVAAEALKARRIITKDVVFENINKLYKEVRALSSSDAAALDKMLRQEGGRFVPMIHVVQTWRQV